MTSKSKTIYAYHRQSPSEFDDSFTMLIAIPRGRFTLSCFVMKEA